MITTEMLCGTFQVHKIHNSFLTRRPNSKGIERPKQAGGIIGKLKCNLPSPFIHPLYHHSLPTPPYSTSRPPSAHAVHVIEGESQES